MAAAADGVGSDKAELKRLLKRAVDEPVHMAFALDGAGKAVIQLDKMKQPKALEKQLKDGVSNAKAVRFGTVAVDKNDPKRVTFMVNKAAGGAARKLAIALKGTGFTKITITSEDGVAEEAQGEDEEEAQGEDDLAAPAAAAQADADAPAPPPAAAAPAAAAGPDAAALTSQLTALVKQMLEAIQKTPSAKAVLAKLATDAQASLKGSDLDQAAAGIESLRQAIADSAGQGPAAGSPAGSAPPAGPAAAAANGAAAAQAGTGNAADPAVAQKLQKSKAAWSATRSKVDADLQKLRKAIADATKGDDTAQDIEKLFGTAVQPLLETLGDELTELLDRAEKADGGERNTVMAEVQRVIASHTQYVSSNPVISHLDDNPFLPVSIGKTLSATLSTLSAIVR